MYFLRKNCISILCIIFWCVITLIRVFNHFPWYDEAHAWTIAQDLNLIEIIKLMKYEGHTILWYLCLMPFAKFNIGYPYSMLLVNWFFCFVAMLILWLKSPFNNWIKFFISFSFPFLGYFPVVARCYSIGIMFLFMLCALYKERLKHPNWYALLLILCANTSVMALVGATILGCEFLYRLIKTRKNNSSVALMILAIGLALILLQLIPTITAEKVTFSLLDNLVDKYGLKNLLMNSNVNKFLSVIFVFWALSFFKKEFISLFLVLTFAILTFIFLFIYIGYFWHYFFYYIFFICSIWLNSEKLFSSSFSKCLNVTTLILVSIFLIFWTPSRQSFKNVYYSQNLRFINNFINEDEFLNKSTILYDDMNFIPMESLQNGRYINYCFSNVRVLPIANLKGKYCDIPADTKSVNINWDYERLKELFTPNSSFLSHSNLGEHIVIFNKYNKTEFFLLNHYKTLSINNNEYKFYKIEKNN